MRFHSQQNHSASVSTFANHDLKIPSEHQQTHTPHPSLSSEECPQTCSPLREKSGQGGQSSREPRGQEGGLEVSPDKDFLQRFHQQFKKCLFKWKSANVIEI